MNDFKLNELTIKHTIPAYYHTEKKLLIFVPLRCGSSVFQMNMNVLPIQRLDHDYSFYTDTVSKYLNDTKLVSNSYLMFRDPMHRILSYFNSFVFDINGEHNKSSKIFWETFINWVSNLDLHIHDAHVYPLNKLLLLCNLTHSLNKLTIVLNRHYSHFLYYVIGHTTIDKQHTPMFEQYELNSYTLPLFLEAYDYIKEIYAGDYEIMKKATYDWKNLYIPEQ